MVIVDKFILWYVVGVNKIFISLLFVIIWFDGGEYLFCFSMVILVINWLFIVISISGIEILNNVVSEKLGMY